MRTHPGCSWGVFLSSYLATAPIQHPEMDIFSMHSNDSHGSPQVVLNYLKVSFCSVTSVRAMLLFISNWAVQQHWSCLLLSFFPPLPSSQSYHKCSITFFSTTLFPWRTWIMYLTVTLLRKVGTGFSFCLSQGFVGYHVTFPLLCISSASALLSLNIASLCLPWRAWWPFKLFYFLLLQNYMVTSI